MNDPRDTAPAPGPSVPATSVPRTSASGTPTVDVPAPAPRSPASRTGSRADWAELLRLPALFTVPGDALAGASTVAARPGRRTLLAIGASLCLYQAGMALNDWADREVDAVERPHRPLPSGRIAPAAALTGAAALTAAGIGCAALAGRPALATAAALAATVWAYDLGLKHTPLGPVAMGTARALDLVLGATANGGRARRALPAAAALGTHTLAVTAVSRHEAYGGSTAVPLTALAATTALARTLLGPRPPAGAHPPPAGRRGAAPLGLPGTSLQGALTAGYLATVAVPLWHAALNPSPPLTRRAVGAGIRAMIPFQAALCARAGAPVTATLTAALAPAARTFARRVSIT
ncbi:SCO3242 family prenyltransferase [Streptomyces uncialis]|uniref:SCO3242 family prenyltransferase n=1 Tax=Streptomyces uncialis TaxID=1048205 RepID=UPI0037F7C72C